MKVNGFIQVRQDISLLKPGIEMAGKIVERCGSIRMTQGTECKCFLIQVNGLIQVRQDTPPLKPSMEMDGKVIER
jgi:hypothetical protein